ncbi:hypothetical protein [Comamonas sediminis]|uniref:Uncharacterized protein n=1 Tax=Comamonas sediminis TaxID=1783360 RepID=A0ABV4B3U5_9BURK
MSVLGVAETVTGPEVADEPPEAAVIVTAAPLPTAPTQLSTWNDSTPALSGLRLQVSTVRSAFSEPPPVPLHTVPAVAVGSQRIPAGKVAVIVLLSVFDAL